MSSTTAAETDRKRSRLERYLRRQAADGEFYFKSKQIADDVDLSAKEIGALLPDLRQSAPALEIEEWGYSNATTWRVRSGGD